ncbi:hypothetical protein AB833_25915 [Chromatiales bacterium (ex Bugula neritina AB1)]|nr:hypothetical protein AB833_25915 [Chromatiales bacterium (ex Bugula neritina AB1)]
MNKPNTFVIGAPKCGTTALCKYLELHTNIFMCDPKEPHFFAHQDMPGRKHYYTNIDTYLELFQGAKSNQNVLIEGSVWYLFCENAIKRIFNFNPKAKLIVMLRRPDEMVYSYHSQAIVSFSEDITDFELAWRTSKGPNPSRTIPKHCDEPKVLQYDQIAKYGDQLERLFSIFDRSQIMIILFDDFKSNTEKTYNDVLNFLELPPESLPSFEKINENKVITNKTIGRILTKPPGWLLQAIALFKRLLGIKNLNVRERLLNSVSRNAERTPLSLELRQEIIDNYREDILKTQRITNLSLEKWLN